MTHSNARINKHARSNGVYDNADGVKDFMDSNLDTGSERSQDVVIRYHDDDNNYDASLIDVNPKARTIVQQDGAYGGGTEWNGDSAHASHWDDEDYTTTVSATTM